MHSPVSVLASCCVQHTSAFGTKVPAKKPKAAMLPIPKSRLEYQSRTTVVNVKGVKPGFFDTEKK